MTKQNKENQRPDAVPASLSAGAVESKFKKGDHVRHKHLKALAGRTGYVNAINFYRREYDVVFDNEIYIIPEDDLVLVDPATEEARQTVFEHENEADNPLTEQAAYDLMYPGASYAVAQYFNLYGPYYIDPMEIKTKRNNHDREETNRV